MGQKSLTEQVRGIAEREIDRLDALSKAEGLSDKDVKKLDMLAKMLKTVESSSTGHPDPVDGEEELSDDELEAIARQGS